MARQKESKNNKSRKNNRSRKNKNKKDSKSESECDRKSRFKYEIANEFGFDLGPDTDFSGYYYN